MNIPCFTHVAEMAVTESKKALAPWGKRFNRHVSQIREGIGSAHKCKSDTQADLIAMLRSQKYPVITM